MINEDYIRGFFDGEGSVLFSKQRSYYRVRVQVSNTCLSILEAVYEFLTTKGYHVSLVPWKIHPNKKHMPLWELYISRWDDVVRFYQEIGTDHPNKRAKFEAIMAYNKTRKLRYPTGGKQAAVRAAEEMLKGSRRIL
jgi:intein-encoded DNA endonuclease-like protein